MNDRDSIYLQALCIKLKHTQVAVNVKQCITVHMKLLTWHNVAVCRSHVMGMLASLKLAIYTQTNIGRARG